MLQGPHQEIEKLNEEFVLALRRCDWERAVLFFTDHPVIVPPSSARAVFAQDLRGFLKQLSNWTLGFQTQDVSLICEGVAREVGIMKLSRKVERATGAEPDLRGGNGTILCQYLGVFQCVDGAWRRNSLIWNRAAQPHSGQPKRAPQLRGGAGGRVPYVPRLADRT